MNEYIDSVRKKPLHHKKRHAMLIAGAVVLVIFAFWSAIEFSTPSKVADNKDGSVNLATATALMTPFEDILHGISSSWRALLHTISNGK